MYMNLKRIIREEIEGLDWIRSETPNWSDLYQHLADEVVEKLPNELDEAGDVNDLLPTLYKIDVANQRFKKFMSNLDDRFPFRIRLQWEVGEFYDSVANIIKAITKRDEGETMFDHREKNEVIYKINLDNIKNKLFGDDEKSVSKRLRSVGL